VESNEPVSVDEEAVPDGNSLAAQDGEAAPRVVAPVITMDAVHRYVETERGRSRRTLLWAGALFLFVLLFVLTMFISVGIFAIRSGRKSEQVARDVLDVSAEQMGRVAAISNSLAGIEEGQEEIEGSLRAAEERREAEKTALESDLVQFRRWIAARNEADGISIARLERRLDDMDASALARREELAAVREQYSALLLALAAEEEAGAAAQEEQETGAPPGPAAPDETPDQPVRAMIEFPATGVFEKVFFDEEDVVAGDDAGTERQVYVVTFPNGDRYEGELRDGLFNGRGIYRYSNGDRYEGEFRDDMKEGRGSLRFRNGDRYVGRFAGDMMNGKGTMLYANRNKYVGDFKNGLRHGNGVMTFVNGDVYKGEFADDARNGRGTYLFINGSKYVGEFRDGQRHGEGHYVFADGSEYVGEFRNGKKWGIGISVYPDGRRVKGLWEKDRFQSVVPN